VSAATAGLVVFPASPSARGSWLAARLAGWPGSAYYDVPPGLSALCFAVPGVWALGCLWCSWCVGFGLAVGAWAGKFSFS